MATSVTSYSVGLTLNADDYIYHAQLSRRETEQLKRVINSSRSPADQYARSLDVLDNAYKKGAIEANAYGLMLDRLNQKYQRNTASANHQSNAIFAMGARYLSLAAAGETVRRAITIHAEIERTGAALEVFTGSAEQSERMMRSMRAMAERTPLSFRGIADAAKTLMSFNVPAEKVMETMQRLGDVTGGNSERFRMLSLAYAQSSAAGRLMGQDLLQMINAGFNPLQEISRKTGRSLIDLKKDMEAGLISFDMVEQAFISATSEGGRFAGMMAKMGDTTAGALDRAQSKMDMLLDSLGEELAPLTLKAAEGFEAMGPAIEKSISGIGLIVEGITSIPDVIDEIKGVFEAVNSYLPGLQMLDSILGEGAADRFKGLGTILTQSPLATAREGRDAIISMMNDDIAGMAKAREVFGAAIYSDDVNARIDRYLEREREVTKEKERQEQIASSAAGTEGDGLGAAAGKDAAAIEKARAAIEERIEALTKELDIAKNIGEQHEMRRIMEAGATQEQAKKIVALQKEIDKTKELAAAEKQRQRDAAAFDDRVQKQEERAREKALDNARKYFERQRELQMKQAEDVEGKFKAIEVGSAEDVRMQAEAMNRMLTAGMKKPDKEPTEEQLLDEARRQYEEAKKQTAIAAQQSHKLDQLIEAARNPPFAMAR